MMEVQTIGDERKLNSPHFRPSPLTPHVMALQNKSYSGYHYLKNNSVVYGEVNKSYKPKVQFPPRRCSRNSTNDYHEKISLKDLMDTLEFVDSTPQTNSESSSETLQLSSSSNSPPSPKRYIPPQGYLPPNWTSSYVVNNNVCNTTNSTMIPDINPDLKNRLLLFKKRNSTKLIQKINYFLSNNRGLSDEEKNEYLKKIHLLSSDFSDINFCSLNGRGNYDISRSGHSETCSHKSLYTSRNLLKNSPYSSSSSDSSKITFKSSLFRKSLRQEKPGFIFELPEWWKRRNEHFKKKSQEREDCICLRPCVTVLCRVCGFRAFSRLKKTCKIHPYIVFFTDIDRCGTCYTYAQLGLFMELDFKYPISSLK